MPPEPVDGFRRRLSCRVVMFRFSTPLRTDSELMSEPWEVSLGSSTPYRSACAGAARAMGSAAVDRATAAMVLRMGMLLFSLVGGVRIGDAAETENVASEPRSAWADDRQDLRSAEHQGRDGAHVLERDRVDA